jgi:hypothetical protein
MQLDPATDQVFAGHDIKFPGGSSLLTGAVRFDGPQGQNIRHVCGIPLIGHAVLNAKVAEPWSHCRLYGFRAIRRHARNMERNRFCRQFAERGQYLKHAGLAAKPRKYRPEIVTIPVPIFSKA